MITDIYNYVFVQNNNTECFELNLNNINEEDTIDKFVEDKIYHTPKKKKSEVNDNINNIFINDNKNIKKQEIVKSNITFDLQLNLKHYEERELHFMYNCITKSKKSISTKHFIISIEWFFKLFNSYKKYYQHNADDNNILFMAVQIFNTILNNNKLIYDLDLKILILTCYTISHKFENNSNKLITSICKNFDCYTKKQLIEAEKYYLFFLNFDINYPNIYSFVLLYLSILKLNKISILYICRYISRVCLFEQDLIVESSSRIASTVLYISLKLFDIPFDIEEITGYNYYDLMLCKEIIIKSLIIHKFNILFIDELKKIEIISSIDIYSIDWNNLY